MSISKTHFKYYIIVVMKSRSIIYLFFFSVNDMFADDISCVYAYNIDYDFVSIAQTFKLFLI